MSDSCFENFKFWRKLTGESEKTGLVIYGGDQFMQTSNGKLLSWRELDSLSVSA